MRHKERLIGKPIYNPVSKRPSPGGLSQYIPPRSSELSGVLLNVRLDGLEPLTLWFLTGDTLLWAEQGENFRQETYECVKVTPSVYLIFFPLSNRKPATLATFVWDRSTMLITAVMATLGADESRPKLVHSRSYFGACLLARKPLETRRHAYTDELVGRRIVWQYTPNDSVMHIYQSQTRMRLWLVQPQLMDTATEEQRKGFQRFIDRRTAYPIYEEPVEYIKIAENLYLYTSVEENLNRALPAQGGGQLAIVLDATAQRYVGRGFGAGADGKPAFGVIGAIGQFSDEPDEVEAYPCPYYRAAEE